VVVIREGREDIHEGPVFLVSSDSNGSTRAG